jgi:uncharacterized protein (TIGR04255 family)
MAVPRRLSRPPITEALVDIRAVITQPQTVYTEFAKELKNEFPKVHERRSVEGQITVRKGKLIIPQSESQSFSGLRVLSADESLIAQFRPDGFTLNNLKNYVGGDRLITLALDLWTRFVAIAKPPNVSRVALRFINQLSLPLNDGDRIRKFLTTPAELPAGAPQDVAEFLSRVVAYSEAANATAIVTQRLTKSADGQPLVVLDVDVSQMGDFSTDAAQLREVLERLRQEKNRTFFAMLTEETVNLYV